MREHSDEQAFNELYARYAQMLVYTAFYKIDNQEVAEDYVHDIFVSLWVNRAKLHIRKSVRAYLFSALKKHVISHYYKQISHNVLSLDDVTDEELTGVANLHNPSTTFIVEEFYERSLQKLPEKCREVFMMSRSGYSIKEIADTLHISEKTVEAHISKALRILRTQFKDYTITVLLPLWVLLH